MSSINQNTKFFILGLIVLATVVPAVWLMSKDQQPKTLVSPLPASKSVTNYEEEQKSISYYITTSQEFLNKARGLANQNSSQESSQTPEEKQKIMELINRALDLVNQAIAFWPNDDRGFSQRANIYASLIPFLPESANFAIQDLKEAISLNNQNPSYYTRLANLYSGAGDFEAAALAFYNTHLLQPTELQTLYNLADSLEKSGQLSKASRYFEKLLALLPMNDENQQILENRYQNIQAMLAKSKLQYLNEPGEPVPAASSKNGEIIGTQELPLEQAAMSGKLIIASDQQSPIADAQSSATVSVNAKTGEGVIPAGKTEVTIYNNNVANDKQIVIVPIGETQNKVLFVAAKKAPSPMFRYGSTPGVVETEGGWFKVGIDQPIEIDIKFNWWIIN